MIYYTKYYTEFSIHKSYPLSCTKIEDNAVSDGLVGLAHSKPLLLGVTLC